MMNTYNSTLSKIPFSIWLLCIVALLMLTSSCAAVDRGMMSVSDSISSADPVTGERQINLKSEESEIDQAATITAAFLAKAKEKGLKVDEETSQLDRVKTVFERLTQVGHRKNLPWEIHVIKDKNFNAFTVGGGKVFVNTGLFDPDIGVRTDDELAAVLAHEIAHVAARHATERQGKFLVMGLANKELSKDTQFTASFTTIQEDEADRYSVIYSALAGYDPDAAIDIWTRLHKAFGSDAGDLLHDHPLNDDRAVNLTKYASKAKQYFTPGQFNAKHEVLLLNNAVFSYKHGNEIKAGEGGGFLALLETAANTLGETLETKTEKSKRQSKQLEQERIANRSLVFRGLEVGPAQGGGYGLFGTAINTSGKQILKARGVVEYLLKNTIIFSEEMPLELVPKQPNSEKNFGIILKTINYDAVRVRPKYIQFVDE